jgi:GxxExxY protein
VPLLGDCWRRLKGIDFLTQRRKEKLIVFMFICSGGDDGDDEVSKYIIGAAIEVHRELGGPDLLETLYEEALCQELVSHGLNVQRQYAVEVEYKGRALKKRLVLDLLVEHKVVVEVNLWKSIIHFTKRSF